MPSESGLSAKALVRGGLVGLAIVLTSPLWLLVRATWRRSVSNSLFGTFSEALSLIPGVAGIYIRRGYYRMTLEAYAVDASLGFLTTVSHRTLRIGKGVYVGKACTLGMAEIADHAMIGSNVDVLSGAHQHQFDVKDRSVELQDGSFRRVRIGRNTWLGNGVILMADVGDGCFIGAGSVVVKPIPSGTVAVGNPARVIKHHDLPLPRAALAMDEACI
jgi:acetyltransferase-like isoleucine patch superfamily enzyme